MQFLHIRYRIIISLLIAVLVVFFYGKLSSTPFITAYEAVNIKNFLASFKLPKIDFSGLLTFKLNSQTGQNNNRFNNNNGPDVFNEAPRPTEELLPTEIPTPTDINEPTGSISPTNRLPTSGITQAPTATKAPKPTPTPKLPAVTSTQRPGNTLAEIFDEVSKRECVPAAFLYAIQTQETGPWWPLNTATSKVKIYNKYGWWLDGSGNSCTGMGYHTQTGVVPSDAVDAGAVCQNALGGTDQGIMGILQISQFEEDAAKKYMSGVIKGSIDRRVLFDNTVIFAIITKNRLGTPPSNCNDWPDDVIKAAAEKHYGSCGDNYCSNVLKYYKQYK